MLGLITGPAQAGFLDPQGLIHAAGGIMHMSFLIRPSSLLAGLISILPFIFTSSMLADWGCDLDHGLLKEVKEEVRVKESETEISGSGIRVFTKDCHLYRLAFFEFHPPHMPCKCEPNCSMPSISGF